MTDSPASPAAAHVRRYPSIDRQQGSQAVHPIRHEIEERVRRLLHELAIRPVS